MKKKYISPLSEVIEIEEYQVICDSGVKAEPSSNADPDEPILEPGNRSFWE